MYILFEHLRDSLHADQGRANRFQAQRFVGFFVKYNFNILKKLILIFGLMQIQNSFVYPNRLGHRFGLWSGQLLVVNGVWPWKFRDSRSGWPFSRHQRTMASSPPSGGS